MGETRCYFEKVLRFRFQNYPIQMKRERVLCGRFSLVQLKIESVGFARIYYITVHELHACDTSTAIRERENKFN